MGLLVRINMGIKCAWSDILTVLFGVLHGIDIFMRGNMVVYHLLHMCITEMVIDLMIVLKILRQKQFRNIVVIISKDRLQYKHMFVLGVVIALRETIVEYGIIREFRRRLDHFVIDRAEQVGEEKNNLVVYSPCDAIGDVADSRSAVRKDLRVRLPLGAMKVEVMNEITASMRICLIGRAEDLQHLLNVGIEDADWYRNACECFVLLNSIDEDERTSDEVSQHKYLLDLTSKYEEEHYRHGN